MQFFEQIFQPSHVLVKLDGRRLCLRLSICPPQSLLDLSKQRLRNTDWDCVSNLRPHTGHACLGEEMRRWEVRKTCQLLQVEAPLPAGVKIGQAASGSDALR
jgi:hypothetical protein